MSSVKCTFLIIAVIGFTSVIYIMKHDSKWLSTQTDLTISQPIRIPEHIIPTSESPLSPFPVSSITPHSDNPSSDDLSKSEIPEFRIHKTNSTVRQKNLMFIKTHKTGSSTLSTTFYLYGIRNRLNFVLKPFKNILGSVSTNHIPILLPPREEEEWNIQVQHCVFNPEFEHKVLPKSSSFYTTVLREPQSQFLSAFSFYEEEKRMRDKCMKCSFDDLVNLYMGESCPATISTEDPPSNDCLAIKSSAEDLGWKQFQRTVGSKSLKDKVNSFIAMLDEEMDLVMITERIDESLAVLKQYMNWNMSDILYFNQKVAQKRSDRELLQTTKNKISYFKFIENKLYKYFNQSLDRHIDKLGREKIKAEVIEFKTYRQSFEDKCRTIMANCLECTANGFKAFPAKIEHPECYFLQYPEFRLFNKAVTDLRLSDDFTNVHYNYRTDNQLRYLHVIIKQILSST